MEARFGANEKLRKAAQQVIEPGEMVHQVVLCQTGSSPWIFGYFNGLIDSRIVVVTDRAIVLAKINGLRGTPKEVVARMPRNIRLGPWEGKLGWSKIVVAGEPYWVQSLFRSELEAADAALISSGPISPPT